MRTAICFSGHLRSFETTFPYLKETVINPMKADVFIHTWEHLGAPSFRNKGDGSGEQHMINIAHIRNLAHPISFLVEKDNGRFINATKDIRIKEEEKIFIAGHVGFHVSMFYSIFKANQLKCEFEKLHNFKYDRVIRFRPDIRMGTTFVPQLFPNNNVLYIPEIGKYTEEGMNDQVAIASSAIMDTYCDTYNNIVEYYRNHSTVARPEMLLKHHLLKNNVQIHDLDIQYDIYRFDGTIFRQHRLGGYDPGVRWK